MFTIPPEIPPNAQWLGDFDQSETSRENEIGILRGTNNLGIKRLYGSERDPYVVEPRSGMSGIEYWKVPVVIDEEGSVTLGRFTYKVKWAPRVPPDLSAGCGDVRGCRS